MKKSSSISSNLAKLLLVVGLVLTACAGPNSSTSSDPAMSEPKPCPTFVASEGDLIPQEQADMLIGMTEADGEACALELGWLWRVGERDGELFALTRDYRQNRVTVFIQEGLIYKVEIG